MNSYQLLIGKLNEFIRKYYKNRLLRGLLLFIGVFILFSLAVAVLEYFGQFGTLERTIMFYAYLAVNAIILWRLILVSLFKLFRIGKTISHTEAAQIIGAHFPEVRDKLLNTLQLKGLEPGPGGAGKDLIEASIDQKISELQPVPFKRAIDLKKNRKYLKYALIPIFLLLAVIAVSPTVVTEPTTRIINHNTYYEPVIPFTLEVLNDELAAIQQEDYTLEVKAAGEELPAEVYIELEGLKYRFNKKAPAKYAYTFRNLQQDMQFHLVADRYRSEKYELKVMPKPIILSFETVLDYPGYTGKKDETLENTGDLVVPAGTRVTWKYYTRDTEVVGFSLGEKRSDLEQKGSNTFEVSEKILDNTTYSVITSNDFMVNKDSLFYSVSVIPDIYPTIRIEDYQDSIDDKRLYFRGLIKDDYGFSKLTYNYIHYQGGREVASEPEPQIVSLDYDRNVLQYPFFHFFHLDSIGIRPGDEVDYYFEVWDNDRINGPKRARSKQMTFRAPTEEEITEQTRESNEQIRDDMEETLDELKNLQKDIDELSKKLLQKESIGWQEKQQIEDLLKRQKQIEETIEQVQQENLQKSLKEKQYKEIDEELMRKQQQLEELFEKVMDDEMKKLFEELQELMDEIDKDEMNEMLEEMKLSNEEIEKQLDRNLELFKQLEFEKMLEESIEKLEELAEKQEQLSEESLNKEGETEDMKKKQEELNEEFEEWRKEQDEMHRKNQELENPNNIEKTDEQEDAIQQDQQESMENLNDNKQKKAGQSQQNASGKMKNLAQKMRAMQNQMYQENLGEDIDDLREILENLVQISFDQEDLMDEVNETPQTDPRYVELVSEQNQLKDDIEMVGDSLFALSKRQPMVEPYVLKEMDVIDNNVEKAMNNLNDRRVGEATGNQQFVMMGVNNLALLLSETLEQMMQAMQMQGSGQCSKGNPKPGQGQKPSAKSMRQLQQQLNQQLEQMKEGMKKGKGNDGDKGSRSSMNEKLARMAAEQAAIRRMMEQYQDELKKQGMGNSKELESLMKEMDQTETELVNKIITQQTLERQKEILSRLLKHEKAELEREKEERRESREAREEILSNPNEFLEYKRIKSQEVELLRTVPPNLRPYYKNKVNDYFYNFELK
jgi:hypothetical protein